MNHATDVQMGGIPYTIQPIDGDRSTLGTAHGHPTDLDFVRASWRDGYKKTPKASRLPPAIYKQTLARDVDRLLARDDVQFLGAFDRAGRCLGWVAWTPWRGLSVLHWVYVRHELNGQSIRGRGIATALLEAADLGTRVSYTLVGPGRRRQGTADKLLVQWAKERGVTAHYVGVEEFLR